MRRKILFVLISLLVFSLVLLTSCGKTTGNENKTDSNIKENDLEKIVLAPLEGLSEYKLVRADNASDKCIDAMMTLYTEISDKLGIKMAVATDALPNHKEILIGSTSRDQSKNVLQNLNYKDFVIKQVGEKLIITGGSDKSTVKAVEYFIENFINKENKTLMVPQGDGYSYVFVPKINKMTICGADINDFKLSIAYNHKTASDSIVNLIDEFIGYELPLCEDEMNDDEHYIVINNTCLTYGDYSIRAKDGNLYIDGSYSSVEGAVEELRKIFSASGETLTLQEGGSIKGNINTFDFPYKNKDELLKIFEFLYEDERVLSGQHLAGNTDFNWHMNDYAKAVGEGPSIMDIDFVSLRNMSEGEISRLLCQAVEYAAKGGVITTMHHWLNPAHPEDQSRGTLDSIDDWDEVITKGTALNIEWHKELDIAGEFFAALRDAGVSVVFRPMHEANGNWFWFCGVYPDMGVVDSEQMIDMWKYVYHYYTDDLGLNNLLWSYAPNISHAESGNKAVPLPMYYYYPGDEYCDIVGMDWYTDGTYELSRGKSYETLMSYEKPVGITEWGIGGAASAGSQSKQVDVFNCQHYLDILARMAKEGKKIAFVEFYAGKFGCPSYVGNGEALANSSIIVSLEEMPDLIQEILK